MAHIAVGGFQHETNTFAPQLAAYADFAVRDSWPPLTRGPEMFDAVAGINLPIEGFVQAARSAGHRLVPLLWCSAGPSSYVTEDAFERIMAMLLEDLQRHAPFDAVYLDLHGAMVTEHLEDGEGEILARVRGVVGDIPLVNSLDLHANVTERMMRLSSAMTVYRTYPHLDMDATGARVLPLLERLLGGETLHGALAAAPFLVPLAAQWTGASPNRELYARVAEMEGRAAASVDLALGFPPADIRECGPAAIAYDADPVRAEAAVAALMEAFVDAEDEFDSALLDADSAVREAMGEPRGPVVLADAQDNPGAGGTGDTVGILESLVRNHARGAVFGVVCDAEVARLAHAAGTGAEFDAPLGGKSGGPGQAPFHGRFRVEQLGDGVLTCTGEMYRGNVTALGPMAVLRVVSSLCDVRVVVASQRVQNLDQVFFRGMGVEPREQHILVVKSTVHFRADYQPIASRVIVVESPGAHPCRLTALPYRNLREGVRLEPNGPAHPVL